MRDMSSTDGSDFSFPSKIMSAPTVFFRAGRKSNRFSSGASDDTAWAQSEKKNCLGARGGVVGPLPQPEADDETDGAAEARAMICYDETDADDELPEPFSFAKNAAYGRTSLVVIPAQHEDQVLAQDDQEKPKRMGSSASPPSARTETARPETAPFPRLVEEPRTALERKTQQLKETMDALGGDIRKFLKYAEVLYEVQMQIALELSYSNKQQCGEQQHNATRKSSASRGSCRSTGTGVPAVGLESRVDPEHAEAEKQKQAPVAGPRGVGLRGGPLGLAADSPLDLPVRSMMAASTSEAAVDVELEVQGTTPAFGKSFSFDHDAESTEFGTNVEDEHTDCLGASISTSRNGGDSLGASCKSTTTVVAHCSRKDNPCGANTSCKANDAAQQEDHNSISIHRVEQIQINNNSRNVEQRTRTSKSSERDVMLSTTNCTISTNCSHQGHTPETSSLLPTPRRSYLRKYSMNTSASHGANSVHSEHPRVRSMRRSGSGEANNYVTASSPDRGASNPAATSDRGTTSVVEEHAGGGKGDFSGKQEVLVTPVASVGRATSSSDKGLYIKSLTAGVVRGGVGPEATAAAAAPAPSSTSTAGRAGFLAAGEDRLHFLPPMREASGAHQQFLQHDANFNMLRASTSTSTSATASGTLPEREREEPVAFDQEWIAKLDEIEREARRLHFEYHREPSHFSQGREVIRGLKMVTTTEREMQLLQKLLNQAVKVDTQTQQLLGQNQNQQQVKAW